jgi:8-oxo-dGTP pyrophosphatase MutT (NUDIX family)
MKIRELLESDSEHAKTLQQTGFWGKQAAGCVMMAKKTQRLGIAHRSQYVEQPGTWGTIGGAIDEQENPQVAVIREVQEELGYHKQSDDYLIPLDLFTKGTFKYTTFLYIVENEFEPILDWESQGFGWFALNNLPSPLHFGIKATLSKPSAIEIIKKEQNKYAGGRNIR